MDRAEKKRRQRAVSRFNERRTFTPDEVKQMNIAAYEMGAQHIAEAVADVYGLGDKRLERIKEKLELLQQRDFSDFKATGNIEKVIFNRDQRRLLLSEAEKRKTKILDGP